MNNKFAQDYDGPERSHGDKAKESINHEEVVPEPRIMRSAPFSLSNTSSIIDMQKAIVSFAHAASSSDVTSMKGNVQGKEIGTSGEYLGGSDPFGKFLAQHIQAETGNAEQYTNTNAPSSIRQNAGIEDTNLRGILDTIKRIGAPGEETKPDGIWKQRTNNALNQIKKVMETINSISEKMGNQIKGLNEVLSSFSQLVPEKYEDYSDAQKNQAASKLVPLIQQLTSYFNQFKQSILNNGELKSYIDQRKPFVSYKQAPSDLVSLLSPEQNNIYLSNVNAHIQNLSLNGSQLSLVDLSSLNNFKSFLQKAKVNQNDPSAVAAAIKQVQQSLGISLISQQQKEGITQEQAKKELGY
jgi:hypothetical protein